MLLHMNNEDMSDLVNRFSKFMNSSEVSSNSSISPEFISNMANMMKNMNNASNNHSNSTNSDSTINDSENSSQIPNFDMNTILKMKSIFDQMNKKDDPRSNLLLSLKPYLKESRKNKVEQYVQLFNMSKVLDIFNNSSSGGAQK